MISTDSLQFVKGIGPKRIQALNLIGINSISDLLYYFPYDYLDRSKIVKIEKLKNFINKNEEVTIVAEIFRQETRRTRNGKKIFILTVKDETGFLPCLYFHGAHWLSKMFNVGDVLALSSFVEIDKYNRPQFIHSEHDRLFAIDDDDKTNWKEKLNTGAIIPKYHLNEELRKVGIEQRQLRKIMRDALNRYLNSVEEYLPRAILNERALLNLQSAISHLHFPDSLENKNHALKRIKYDESFYFQLLIAFRKKEIEEDRNGINCKSKNILNKKLLSELTFNLTSAQQKVISEISHDMSSTKPMNRLLQGDVGSGKTIVSFFAMLSAIENNLQVALMAPTEILAEQHFATISHFAKNLNLNIRLLVGKQSKKLRSDILEDIGRGSAQIIIGTHALFQKHVVFENLGLVVIDEQHRFGVSQRAQLREKGKSHPHLLVMTATPIPRSLAMTLYGDLDISTIDEMPKNRKKIKTAIRFDKDKVKIYDFIRKEISEQKQAYIVVPLIEESEKVNYKSAIDEFENLQKNIFTDLKLGLLHGKLSSDEKRIVMEKFAKNKINILVSTTVIEVGIDVANATVMMIEDAEKFGLAQLHQLRGRVGRGTEQSYCILISKLDEKIKTTYSENKKKISKELKLQKKIRDNGCDQ